VLTFVSGTIFILRRFFILFYFIILEIRKYLVSICFKDPGVTNFGILSNPFSFQSHPGHTKERSFLGKESSGEE
jgi:hypothetical protein